MSIYKFNKARVLIPDAKLILKQEGEENIKRDVLVNRFILSSVSEYFTKLFYWNSSPEQLVSEIKKEGCSPKILELIEDAIFPTKEMKVSNVHLFSGLIDSIYAMNVEDYISTQKSEDLLTLLRMCAEYLIEVPYIEILRNFKGSKEGSFENLLLLLEQLDEIKEKNIPWISTWVCDKEELSIIQGIQREEFISKIEYFMDSRMIITCSNGTIAVYNYKSGILLKAIKLDEEISEKVSLSNSLGMLAIVVEGKIVIFLSVNDLMIVAKIEFDQYVHMISFAPNGTILAVALDNVLKFFEVEKLLDFSCKPFNKMKFNVPGRDPINDIAWKDMTCFVAITDGIYKLELDIINKDVTTQKIFDHPEGKGRLNVNVNGSVIIVFSFSDIWIRFLSIEENYKDVFDPLKFEATMLNVVVSPSGTMIAIDFFNDTKIIKEWGTHKTLYRKETLDSLYSFTPENDAVVLAKENILIWYLNSEENSKKPMTFELDLPEDEVVFTVNFFSNNH